MQEKEVLDFIGAVARSLWTLELLTLIRQSPDKQWSVQDLVRALRASTQVVQRSVVELRTFGFVASAENGSIRYRAPSPKLDELAAAARTLYSLRPVAVMNVIATSPDEKLRLFANAFRLKE